MKKTTTPLQTPSPHTAQSHMSTEVGRETNTLAEFFSVTLTMSWQLAIVVLIPVLGGFELDKKLHTQPFLTIIGFVLAIAGVVFVVWRQFQLVSQLSAARNAKEPHS
jgi:F0F1-type ATP synthase assembly protein I